jgi:hypothetical protein
VGREVKREGEDSRRDETDGLQPSPVGPRSLLPASPPVVQVIVPTGSESEAHGSVNRVGGSMSHTAADSALLDVTPMENHCAMLCTQFRDSADQSVQTDSH